MTRNLWLTCVGILTLVGASAGCSRAYLTPSHGRAVRQAFAVQTVNPGRETDARAVQGLDSQEASIISTGYRKSLAPKDEAGAATDRQILYSPRGGLRDAPMVPATSVPAEH